MAAELEQTGQFIDAIVAIGDVSKLFTFLPVAGPALSVLSMIFGIIGSFLPNKNQEEILAKFKILENKLEIISDDIKDLERKMDWQTVEIQYAQVVSRITHGMEYLNEAIKFRKLKNENKYRFWMNQTIEVSSGHQMKSAVRVLRDGLIGKGLFQKEILDGIYTLTRGDRPKVTAMAARLLQLMNSGIVLVVAVESYTGGKESGENFAAIYSRELHEVEANIKAEIKRCVDNFEVNIREDLRRQLQSGSSNEQSVKTLRDLLQSKYDFLATVVLIYNDIHGYDKHTYGGSEISMLHFNGKCGIVFYALKPRPCSSQKASIEATVTKLVVHHLFYIHGITRAIAGYERVQKIYNQGVGIAVVKRNVGLWYASTSSADCNVIWINGRFFTYFMFL